MSWGDRGGGSFAVNPSANEDRVGPVPGAIEAKAQLAPRTHEECDGEGVHVKRSAHLGMIGKQHTRRVTPIQEAVDVSPLLVERDSQDIHRPLVRQRQEPRQLGSAQ